jgi:hypothetical protein
MHSKFEAPILINYHTDRRYSKFSKDFTRWYDDTLLKTFGDKACQWVSRHRHYPMILTLESNDRYRLSRIYERLDSEVEIVYGLHTKIRMIGCWELWNSGIKAVYGLRTAIHMFGAPKIVVIYKLKIILLLRRASQSSSGTMRMCWELTERSSWELRRVCSDTRSNVDSIQILPTHWHLWQGWTRFHSMLALCSSQINQRTNFHGGRVRQ